MGRYKNLYWDWCNLIAHNHSGNGVDREIAKFAAADLG